jgi:hypothetical protein
MLLSLTIYPLRDHLIIKKGVRLNILLIVSITLPIAASAIPSCLIATFKVFSKLGAFKERSYHKIL